MKNLKIIQILNSVILTTYITSFTPLYALDSIDQLNNESKKNYTNSDISSNTEIPNNSMSENVDENPVVNSSTGNSVSEDNDEYSSKKDKVSSDIIEESDSKENFKKNPQKESDIFSLQPVSNLKVDKITSDSAKITWDAPNNINGLIDYSVYKDSKLVGKTSKLSYLLKDLDDLTSYNIQVFANYINGEASTASSVKFKTLKSDSSTINNSEIIFSDVNLENALRDILKKPTGAITKT
ncbi:fibronectin type III domain-containing protein, partial [Clostridium perfringens]